MIDSIDANLDILGVETRTEGVRSIIQKEASGFESLFTELSRHDWPIDPADKDYQRFHGTVLRLVRALPASEVAGVLKGPSADDDDLDLCLIAQGVAGGTVSEVAGFRTACSIPGYSFEGFVDLIEQAQKAML